MERMTIRSIFYDQHGGSFRGTLIFESTPHSQTESICRQNRLAMDLMHTGQQEKGRKPRGGLLLVYC